LQAREAHFGVTQDPAIQYRLMLRRVVAGIGAVTLILSTASSVRADIYRCKRPNGVHHYTNIREAGRRCELVVRGSNRSRSSAKNKSSAPRSTSGRAPSDRARYSRYDALIDEAAALYELPQSFIRAIMRVESDFNSTVVSRAGAMGLMQLMPMTAQSMGVLDPFDARQNILGGARYLRILANRFSGDLVLTVAAYNAGEGAVEKYNGIPPYEETQRYVRRVLKHYYAYRTESSR
jgi:soluble lytic murein transglycosylase-like protein